ncbi:adenylyltransferase and sulfurtransferase MOCS3-like isoform X2 [Stylophora pistillata]|uniref:adenylyltransferase and sulfurtransferase MOCS3-like isoform X2 n=1 Tax=Stylophora pistillata TaxID=50429 RepID=UPI000C03B5A6|nr:adenylyltransferase and sulfurtransferase MOCS3-like isoform X2 [Stylophora pistillata]
MADELEALRREIERKSLELESLKNLLALKEKEYKASNSRLIASNSSNAVEPEKKERLTKDEILRYSRQLILPEIGVKGQIKLCNASVLVVGAGGLGCPVAQYLAAAGVGHIGTVDYDTVEISNLHRQVLHTESRVNISKAESIKIQIHQYLLNDACILAGKPLVSGSALRFEGQLTVYNHDGGPCYRCLFPKPPPPESVGNCSDNGVLGPVPGVIGTLQALEAIKIIVGTKSSYSQKMLIYDALDGRFLTIKLRPRQSNCAVCGDNPSIRKLMDYELFCGASATDKTPSLEILQEQQRISVHEYKRLIDECSPHILLDVREPVELEICSLPVETLNIPLRVLHSPDHQDVLIQAILNLADNEKKLSTVNETRIKCCAAKMTFSSLRTSKMFQRQARKWMLCLKTLLEDSMRGLNI